MLDIDPDTRCDSEPEAVAIETGRLTGNRRVLFKPPDTAKARMG